MGQRFGLSTYQAARRTLSRLMREFAQMPKEERDVQGFRALTYSFNILLGFFALERDENLEKRLEAVEARLSQYGQEEETQ